MSLLPQSESTRSRSRRQALTVPSTSPSGWTFWPLFLVPLGCILLYPGSESVDGRTSPWPSPAWSLQASTATRCRRIRCSTSYLLQMGNSRECWRSGIVSTDTTWSCDQHISCLAEHSRSVTSSVSGWQPILKTIHQTGARSKHRFYPYGTSSLPTHRVAYQWVRWW